MRQHNPLAPLIEIARRGVPFTASDGQAFVRLGVPSGGFYILPVRSPAYRDWFFHEFFNLYDPFAWDEGSPYVRRPPYFDGMPTEPEPVADITGARVLAMLGDSVTTDHISRSEE